MFRVFMPLLLAGLVTILPGRLSAQSSASASADGVQFASAADVAAARARAEAQTRQGGTFAAVTLMQLSPYRLELEYRTAGTQPAGQRDDTAEMVIVLEGTGAVTTGGTLVNGRAAADGRTGTGVSGGVSREIGPGDQFFLAEGQPAWYSRIDGTLVALSLRLPRPVRPCCVYLGQMGWVPGGSKVDTTFASASVVKQLLEKAKPEMTAQSSVTAPVVQLLPYTSHVVLRERRPGAERMLWHGFEAEFVVVMEGAGTMMTGGTLVDEVRNGDGRRGSAAQGGTARPVRAGDIIFVPERTPHGFIDWSPSVVLRSLHVPRGATF